MKMNYAEWVCPECKTKNRETCSMWMYGSPIRECKACRSEYLDRRWREVAIDGFDPRSKNAKFYAKGAAFLLSMAIICGVLLQTSFVHGNNFTKLTLACILCSLFGVVSGFIALRIKLGFADKDNDKFMAESKARLGDPKYVEKLRKFGYKI
ncbi:hypothetical protein [uncultured Fibrobacter sp.]|uniref:hypothetical protein n=1 Tax=uncultured Fibrobacter sp. TaxID=261512 RepID=UPI00260F3BD5|nr:hypothetical protein [uncultured Fibrobacter sp.]